jgi:hypothetical protein
MARRSPAAKFDRIQKVLRAWEYFAPDSVFYGYTLGQFKAAVRPSIATREEIRDLQRCLRTAIHSRNIADKEAMRLLDDVVNAVKGDPKHGEDGALFAAMGYVRKSARRKRRRRR